MAHAQECSGRVYGCPRCGKREMTISETFDHECPADAVALVLDEDTRYKLKQFSEGSAHEIRLTAEGDTICPVCETAEVSMWADDGEAWAADWWRCEDCGASGAVCPAADHSRTQNGVAVARSAA